MVCRNFVWLDVPKHSPNVRLEVYHFEDHFECGIGRGGDEFVVSLDYDGLMFVIFAGSNPNSAVWPVGCPMA